MAETHPSSPRARVDGRFFRLGEKKFYPQGVCYGPFAPGAQEDPFPSLEQTASDFRQMRELGANLLRVYHVPPRWLLDLAAEHDLKMLIDIPWSKHRCFLDSPRLREEAREAVRQAAHQCAGHASVFAYSVVNEISPGIARWSGAERVADFIDELVAIARSADPGCLCTFGNFPPTEFLRPRAIDFVCFNVYLHEPKALADYLARLQIQAEPKPLLLGEFGIDSLRQGESRQSEMLAWTIEIAFRGGLAGAVVFSFTDDWFMGGRQIEEWSMGLTTRERQPKPAFFSVQNAFGIAPRFPLQLQPKVSVVVACYNGAQTLKACLDSLLGLNYPETEIILVDDGATDATPQIAALYPKVRYIRQAHHGLSVARNTGTAGATGDIVAFIDADCRADEDWLYYLVGELEQGQFAAVGGPNYPPPEDSPVASVVMASPGGPAPVMLTDRLAEHIPGCNMAIYKRALEEAGGFDPIFEAAGDDVDMCWRLQEQGHKIGFSPAAFVWHRRRSTVRAYLKQQEGYGEAEALLERKHPEYFNLLGGSIWRGRIYGASHSAPLTGRPVIHHGVFGTGYFQLLYAAPPPALLMLFTTLEYHALVTLPLIVLSGLFHFLWPLAAASLALSAGVCVTAGLKAELPPEKQRLWSRPLLVLLFFLQPIVRGLGRYKGRVGLGSVSEAAREKMDSYDHRTEPPRELCYWSRDRPSAVGAAVSGQHEAGVSVEIRIGFLDKLRSQLDAQGWPNKTDTGWCDYDLEVFGTPWSRLQLTTVSEPLAGSNELVRCRLQPRWPLRARAVCWGGCGVDLLLIGLAGKWPWLWLAAGLGALALAIFVWFLRQENRNLKNVVARLVEDQAKQLNLIRVDYQPESDRWTPLGGA